MGRSERPARDSDRGAAAGAATASVSGAPNAAEALISRWVDEFNARDLDGMLACLADDVDFHPLRLSGLGGAYRGHDGVRAWFARLAHSRPEHQIVLLETRDVGDGRVFASGSLSLDGEADVGPFSALHRVDGGLIVAAHHYLTDPDIDRAPWSDPMTIERDADFTS